MKIEPEILEDGKRYFKSPNGFKIRKVGTNEIYDSAIDAPNASYEYEETDEIIIKQEEEL